MTINFESLRSVCIHSSGKQLSKCFKTASQCMEENCPLKEEEEVCRWVEIYSEDPDFDYPYYNVSCTESVSEDYLRKYCPNCGGKVVLK